MYLIRSHDVSSKLHTARTAAYINYYANSCMKIQTAFTERMTLMIVIVCTLITPMKCSRAITLWQWLVLHSQDGRPLFGFDAPITSWLQRNKAVLPHEEGERVTSNLCDLMWEDQQDGRDSETAFLVHTVHVISLLHKQFCDREGGLS